MFPANRRGFVMGLVAAASTSALHAQATLAGQPRTLPPLPAASGTALASDRRYWAAVQSLYTVTPKTVNLENGYWGLMADPVRAEYQAKTDMVNRENSYYARAQFGKDSAQTRQLLASAVGAAPEEIAFTRGATEALQLLIGGYNKLKAGDTVLFADLDYDSMQYAMNWLKERRGVNVVKFAIPEPATREAVLQTYQQVLANNPRAKLLLLTHVSHRTGLVMPVADIAAMAKARGVDVVLDAAHSWGQVDFKIAQLGVDFIGFNLHKWIGAPLGLGFLYIAQGRLADIDRAMADEDWPSDDIRSRVHSGTYNFAALLTLPKALALHAEIGPQAKAQRLRYLRDYWVSRARTLKGVDILTPDEPGMVAGITSLRLAGHSTPEQSKALVAQLRDRYGILTVQRGGVAKGPCLRITPALYTTEADLDRFTSALSAITAA
ncbi:Selenocysteine lyase/Cysteine desulfurase [Polaromonas sp. OV174]|uniref:aminotransferase class V-fold PLP-dependent enzyme n=1 Tax=Polaromonas sp. OV174 TaxID=1855300 RepID=UPI0008E09454|nr:aminotransferase class V-fold PLP-dependent enzyme [Polaromonas sp. OV174]SFB79588.1 Selenocysteine lyase/Cysteine desulfurase [Polaromonas sp. OV174]